jgi:hypothetical protein
MNKNTILFLGFVVLCVVVVIVINIAINSPDQETLRPQGKFTQNLATHQHLTPYVAQVPAPVDEQKPEPTYEVTASNGTILF